MADGVGKVEADGPPSLGRRAALLGALGGVAALTVACSSDPQPTTPPPGASSPTPTRNRFAGDPGPGKLYLGLSLAISEPASTVPELGGDRISLARRFYRAHQVELMSSVTAGDVAAGILPFVSFKVPDTWDAIARGDDDRWLDGIVEALDALDAPAFVALHHEPENDIEPPHNTPATWVAMQQRLIQRAASTPKVTPVPILMNWTFREGSGRDPHEWLVPEAALMGVEVYNPWRPGATNWTSFADLYAQVAETVTDQPIVVPELGTTSDEFDPRRASLWIQEAFDTALDVGVVGMAWFDARLRGTGRRELDQEGRQELRSLLDRPEIARISPAGG
ncbi:MAG: hypothetical protein U0R78_00540 [Nocardioidaceae bacterium]